MKLDSLTPILYTENIKATIDFYTTHLGFVCNNIDESISWTSISNNNIEIILSKPNAHIPFEKANFTGSFYFRTEAVDELWNALKANYVSAIQLKILNTVCVNLLFMITMVMYCSLAVRQPLYKFRINYHQNLSKNFLLYNFLKGSFFQLNFRPF